MAGEVHRLNDIEVEEVSLVDRAANKRKFLLIKREEGEATMGEQLVSDGRGGFKRVAKADDKKPDEEDEKTKAAETEKAKPPPFPPKKPDEEKKPGDKDEDKEKPGKKPPPFPPPKKAAEKADASGLAVADDLEALAEEMLDVIDGLRGEEEAEPAEMADKKKKAAAVAEKAHGFIAARRKEKEAEKEGAAKADVAKAGRKISQARLDKLKSALATLDGLIKEVDGGASDEEAAKEKAAKAAKEGTVDEETKKHVATLVTQNAKLIEQNAELAKRFEAQSEEIAQLKKGIPAPNSAAPERAAAKKSEGDPAWPMNMNRRGSRLAKGGRSEDKDDSFLDD